jgi:hypothetical protein
MWKWNVGVKLTGGHYILKFNFLIPFAHLHIFAFAHFSTKLKHVPVEQPFITQFHMWYHEQCHKGKCHER